MARERKREPRFWLWVAHPAYYLEKDGITEREILDPAAGVDIKWSCHKDTRKGDLVLLWRTSPRCDIAYLLQATSNAQPEVTKNSWKWPYSCGARSIVRFDKPLRLKDIRQVPHLADWPALRGKFQKSAWEIPPAVWSRLSRLLRRRHDGYGAILQSVHGKLLTRIMVEEKIEDRIVRNPKVLRKLGLDLRLYSHDGTSGRQLFCKDQGTYIDLLMQDSKGSFWVIELKAGGANRSVFGQICAYMGWVQRELAGKRSVKGLVIARQFDKGFADCLAVTARIKGRTLSEIGIR